MKTAIQGFTLIEAMVVVAIIAILAAVAMPAMNRFAESSRLRGAAEQVAASVNTARTHSIKENAGVTVSVAINAGTWSIRVGTPACAADCITQTSSTEYQGVTLAINPNINSWGIDPVRGAFNASPTLTVTNGAGSLNIRVRAISTPTICSPTGALGYAPCTPT